MDDSTQPALAKGAVRHLTGGARAASRRQFIEATPHYWLFLNSDGILWVRAVGQAAARASAGATAGGMCLLYQDAGTALRVAEQQSAATGRPILNLEELQAAAAKDPEPESGAKRAWAAKKAAKA